MTTGRIVNLKALVRIEIVKDDGKKKNVETMLDTGFTGYLTLQATTIESLDLKMVGSHWVTLADGSEITLQDYSATVLWDGNPREIYVTCTEGISLLGMEMLEGCRITMDVREGGDIRMEAFH